MIERLIIGLTVPLVGSYFGLIAPGVLIIAKLIVIAVKRPFARLTDDIRAASNLILCLSMIGFIGYIASLPSSSLQTESIAFYAPLVI